MVARRNQAGRSAELELYTFADLVRMLRVTENRLRVMRNTGELPGPDIIVPGGGHKAARWSAARVREIHRRWSADLPL